MAKGRKVLLKQFDEYHHLYRDPVTGIAWVEDYSAGIAHSAHSNIDVTGSIRGMKRLGYWRKDDRIVRSHGFYYNIDSLVITDHYDQIAADHCQCGGKCGENRRVRSE